MLNLWANQQSHGGEWTHALMQHFDSLAPKMCYCTLSFLVNLTAHHMTDAKSNTNKSFSALSLRKELLQNLRTLEYSSMTPIQAESIPHMLAGSDVIAQAKTGSGKTAAFGLSLLNHLNVEKYAVQALVLCPTRELAEQVAQSLRQLARRIHNIKVLNLSGGMSMRPQSDSLRHGAHIVVGTPGRVQKHLDRNSLETSHLKVLVLDEADRMLDMGFYDDINNIIKLCPHERQTLLFSATYPSEIKKLAGTFLRDPKHVVIQEPHTELHIEQIFYEVNHQKDKFAILKAALLHHKPVSILVFCNTKDQTTILADMLKKEGFSVTVLNGDMDQAERNIAVIQFKNNSSSILVATDVAARGLDIKGLPAVINYDLAFERDVHIHRIGRTGRAGNKGLAISLTTPADTHRVIAIEDEESSPIRWGKRCDLNTNNGMPSPKMVTLSLNAGKKDKIRPGDILGALTKDAGLPGDSIGNIDITTFYSYVAIHKSKVDTAFSYLQNGKLKGRKVSTRKLK